MAEPKPYEGTTSYPVTAEKIDFSDEEGSVVRPHEAVFTDKEGSVVGPYEVVFTDKEGSVVRPYEVVFTEPEVVEWRAHRSPPLVNVEDGLLDHFLSSPHDAQLEQYDGVAGYPVIAEGSVLRPASRRRQRSQNVFGIRTGEPYPMLLQAPGVAVPGPRVGSVTKATPEPRESGKIVDSAADSAEALGLPVRLLREIRQRGYSISGGASEEPSVRPLLNWLQLQDKDLAHLAVGDLRNSDTQKALSTLYHEVTHAWFDLNSNRLDVKAYEQISRYSYNGSPLTIRGTQAGIVGYADDPDRIFQEAVAGYTEHRVYEWLSTLTFLETLARDPTVRPEVISRMLEQTRTTYDAMMSWRTFGYEDELLSGGWVHTHTTTPMREDLCAFLDEELLEGRIPAKFEQEPRFQALAAEAIRRTHGVPQQ